MSGGTNTTTSSSAPPQQFLDAYSSAVSNAQNVASVPYQQYSGNLLAPLSPDQTAGITATENAQGIAAPYINAGAQYIDAATTPLWGGVQQFSPDTVSQYESPYTSQVVNATQQEFNNQNQQQQQGIVSQAASQGAWGGDRSGVAQGITAGQEQLAQAPVIAGLENTGYTNALGEFNTQQQAQLGANEANAWLNSQAGYGMANLGQEAQNSTLTGANALLGIGGLEQSQAQAGLNIPYEQFTAAQAYPFQTAGWEANIAEGLGGASGGTSSTTSPAPSVASQVGGGALAGAGILGQTGAFGSSGWLTGGGAASGIDTSLATSPTSSIVSGIGGAADTWAARGGALPHRAIGGIVPIQGVPDIAVGTVPGATGIGDPATHGGTMDVLKNYGSTSTSSPSDGGAGQAVGDILTVAKVASMFANRGGVVPFRHRENGGATSDLSDILELSAVDNLRRGGIVANDDYPWREPQRMRAAGGIAPPVIPTTGPDVTTIAGTHGNAIPQLTTAAGIVPTGYSGGGINVSTGQGASQTGSPLLDNYLNSVQAGASYTPPKGYVAPTTPSVGSSAPPTLSVDPSLNDDGQGNSRGGIVPAFDDGGDIPESAPVDLGIPNYHGGPTVPDSGETAGVAAPAPKDVPTEPRAGFQPPPRELVPVIQAAAERNGVDPKPLTWLLSQESHWNPHAYNPESGTMGLGQFKPATAHEEGIDPWNPVQAIRGAASYLRKQLDRTGGDYEAAIGHYGTFSTGHGREADDAVRRQYRQFMGAAADGGGIWEHHADGDVVGDVDPSGLLLPGTHAIPDQPMDAGSPDALPVPPIPPAAPASSAPPPPSAGIVPPPTRATPDEPEKVEVSPWRTLTNVGLGIMSGTSPHAGVNIGAGALKGISLTDQEQRTEEQAAQRRDIAKTNALWRAKQGDLADARAAAVPEATAAKTISAAASAARAASAGRVADATVPLRQSQADLADARAAAVPVTADAATTRAGAAQQNADTAVTRARNQADQAANREQDAQTRIQQAQARMTQTQEYRDQVLALRRQGMDDATISNVMKNATFASTQNRKPLSESVADQLAQRNRARSAAPAPTAIPASPSTPTQTAPIAPAPTPSGTPPPLSTILPP